MHFSPLNFLVPTRSFFPAILCLSNKLTSTTVSSERNNCCSKQNHSVLVTSVKIGSSLNLNAMLCANAVFTSLPVIPTQVDRFFVVKSVFFERFQSAYN